jgi:hypothetical protein
MWTGIVNGQPFFFTDSTNYIRAADMAMHIASGRTFSTQWTGRYLQEMSAEGSLPAKGTGTSSARHNDLAQGMVMAGRSPYFGALMYAGYLSSDFWSFILLQAMVSYALIILTLRRFDVATNTNIAVAVVMLAATTSLPTYNSLLLPDAFFAFGLLSFVLLSSPGNLTKIEVWFLACVLIVSVVSHLHSLAVVMAMLLVLTVLRITRWKTWVPERAWLTGVAAVVIGLASLQVSAWATEAALGKKPQLLPLLTARFIADGPGRAFIASGCEGRRFQICRVHIGEPRSGGAILSGKTRESGTYLLASPAERQRMGEEDTEFAVAVFRSFPLWQSSSIIKNTVRQLLWFDYDGLNTGCFSSDGCWDSLPTGVRTALQTSPSGRNAWPVQEMNVILYIIVVLSLAALIIFRGFLSRSAPEQAKLLNLWIILIGSGMIVGAALGGAGVEPQYRYQGRLIWLIPLLGFTALFVTMQARRHDADRAGNQER